MIKKSHVLIGLGFINLLHASLHILQFIQSIFLVSVSVGREEGQLDLFLHNPIFAYYLGNYWYIYTCYWN